MTARRRALPAAGLTALGLIMLSRFHSAPAAIGVRPRSTSSSSSSVAPTTVPAAGAALGQDPSPTTPTTAPGSNAPSALHDGSFTGTEIETRWGPVQVQIVVSGGQLTDVEAVEVPSSHDRSVEINGQATPILRDEALTAQSADLDLVSGATITWDGYRRSLQAALDLAHR